MLPPWRAVPASVPPVLVRETRVWRARAATAFPVTILPPIWRARIAATPPFPIHPWIWRARASVASPIPIRPRLWRARIAAASSVPIQARIRRTRAVATSLATLLTRIWRARAAATPSVLLQARIRQTRAIATSLDTLLTGLRRVRATAMPPAVTFLFVARQVSGSTALFFRLRRTRLRRHARLRGIIVISSSGPLALLGSAFLLGFVITLGLAFTISLPHSIRRVGLVFSIHIKIALATREEPLQTSPATSLFATAIAFFRRAVCSRVLAVPTTAIRSVKPVRPPRVTPCRDGSGSASSFSGGPSLLAIWRERDLIRAKGRPPRRSLRPPWRPLQRAPALT
ncbi:unnamed protein product [Closterium sp. NIES-64]|nr:unnamed protein product [Closterium sp. NIES-64]